MGAKKADSTLRIREYEVDSLMTPTRDGFLATPRTTKILRRRWTRRRTLAAFAVLAVLAVAFHVTNTLQWVSGYAAKAINQQFQSPAAVSPPEDVTYPRPSPHVSPSFPEEYPYNIPTPVDVYPPPATAFDALPTANSISLPSTPADSEGAGLDDPWSDSTATGEVSSGSSSTSELSSGVATDKLTSSEEVTEPVEQIIEPVKGGSAPANEIASPAEGQIQASGYATKSSSDPDGLAGLKPKPRRALIISSYRGQRLGWMQWLAKDWEVFRYVVDNPEAKYTIPAQGGREAMTYITWILDNYDNLPDYAVFIHGHRQSWHAPEPVGLKLESLNFTALDEDQYISFPTCHPKQPINLQKLGDRPGYTMIIPKLWKYAKLGEGPLPTKLSSPCCAQFAVTKKAILSRTREWWERYRKPLFGKVPGLKQDDFDWGMTYEKLWHVAFGMPTMHCPSMLYCFNVQWSMGVLCNGYPAIPLDGHWNDFYELIPLQCFKNNNGTKEWDYKQWTIHNITKKKHPQHPRDFGKAVLTESPDDFEYKYHDDWD